MLRRIFIILAIAMVIFPVLARADEARAFTVVIDPGHGGKDYGCEGDITNEKTIVLDVATRLGKLISAEHPEVNIIYTRSDDRFITLNERAAIANRAKADLFISVHVNSIDKRTRGRNQVHGASVYTLGLHRTDDNLAVAMRENSVIELENDFSETYQGFDPTSSESYIIFELTQNRHQRNSIELASLVCNELVNTAGRADKGVRQSGFLVLRATSMPSVLVELDFICNPQAERFLHSDGGKEKCARSLANAFTVYYNHHKGGGPTTINAVETAPGQGDAESQSVPEHNQSASQVVYCVQFLTSDKRLDSGDARFKGVGDVNFYMHDNLYKYISGSFPSLNQAKKHLRKLKNKFPEAFIIKMQDGQRVL
ncbi:MAG: N-acetylmuramoyl-L-alanine amidase [Odoribacter sp.]|nr:N-acetylmuramoyl-L-alanine amidase [Odoribacter sp.]